MNREIVLVSGAPGSGKSTLARHLARILGMDLISKDLVTESLWEVFDPRVGDLERSRQLDAAAMEVIWTLAAQSRRTVLDANFHPHSDSEKTKLSGLSAKLVEVYCSCPPEVALKRCTRRATQPGIDPVHAIPILDAAIIEFDKPIGLGSVIEVDTTQVIGIEALAKVISADLADHTDLPNRMDLVHLQP
jgi:predicted kinase